MSKLTKGQIAVLHVARKQCGVSEEDYRALLLRFGGVEHANELDSFGFEAVMRQFEGLGFRSTSPRRPLGHRPGMASDAECALIRRLWLEVTGGEGTDQHLGEWLERFGVSALRFLPADDAGRVIGALRSWAANRRAKESRTPPAA